MAPRLWKLFRCFHSDPNAPNNTQSFDIQHQNHIGIKNETDVVSRKRAHPKSDMSRITKNL